MNQFESTLLEYIFDPFSGTSGSRNRACSWVAHLRLHCEQDPGVQTPDLLGRLHVRHWVVHPFSRLVVLPRNRQHSSMTRTTPRHGLHSTCLLLVRPHTYLQRGLKLKVGLGHGQAPMVSNMQQHATGVGKGVPLVGGCAACHSSQRLPFRPPL